MDILKTTANKVNRGKLELKTLIPLCVHEKHIDNAIRLDIWDKYSEAKIDLISIRNLTDAKTVQELRFLEILKKLFVVKYSAPVKFKEIFDFWKTTDILLLAEKIVFDNSLAEVLSKEHDEIIFGV